jgi:hypothetical protein
MAKPAFIYAFDNLGPERFAELCGLLLGMRYKGFGPLTMGGIGPDGGVDAELYTDFGILEPEEHYELLSDVISPNKKVVFQFKHKVIARVGGQAEARKRLLRLYKCSESSKCELHRKLIVNKPPENYVLVTNVEVNSRFRKIFISQCQNENPNIENYNVIGLDELESWVTMEPLIRHLYFPTIFGVPRFNLKIKVNLSVTILPHDPSHPASTLTLLTLSILNIGTVSSYINSIKFRLLVDDQVKTFQPFDFKDEIMRSNPPPGTELKPGKKLIYYYPKYVLNQMHENEKPIFPFEILVTDEIENEYRVSITDDLRKWILGK